MRWAVEYELPGGSIGMCIFSAEDLPAAQTFVNEMITQYGHDHVFNLNELANGTGIEELYRLFLARKRWNRCYQLPHSECALQNEVTEILEAVRETDILDLAFTLYCWGIS